MKLCWDNIENIRFTKNNILVDIKKNRTYYIRICKQCGEEHLGKKDSKFCSIKCSRKYNSMGDRNPFFGKTHSYETKEKISKSRKGKSKGKDNYRYNKFHKKNIPVYDIFVNQLEWAEEVRRNEQDPNILEVKCFKCNKWFIPTLNNVNNRIQYLKGNYKVENRFYCSDECKNSCSIYHKSINTLMKEDAIRAGRLKWLELKREVQPELREMVLGRDNHKCTKCNNTNDLQCHHILPVNIEPLLSADIDNCITLCKECHKKTHQKDGCKYGQLKIKEC